MSGWGWGSGSQPGLSFSFTIFILRALRKFKINNEACTSFKIEKIKLPQEIVRAPDNLLIAYDSAPPQS